LPVNCVFPVDDSAKVEPTQSSQNIRQSAVI
jgi:hypothetical protein